MTDGLIKIWSDGISEHTKISVVDGDGKETPLTMVSDLEFKMPPNGGPGSFRLGFLFNNTIEVAMPADGSAIARIVEADAAAQAQIGAGPRHVAMLRVRRVLDAAGYDTSDLDAETRNSFLARIVDAVIEGER